MSENAVRAEIQAIDKTLAELQEQLERGFIDFGRYSRLKTDWERKKAELKAQLSGASTLPGHRATGAATEQAGPADLRALRDVLYEYFSDSELRDLCLFELDIDYDGLAGEGKWGKVRELIAYCKRHGRVLELTQACQRLRPHAFG
ncbi:MAG: hypothetical protein PVF45_07300 [Anaerolineae bacterium]|jgi:hypothetical protein